jgi:hypothetical protein
MCSFILQRLICKRCRSPGESRTVDHKPCGKPPKACPGRKKRGTVVRYVKPEECDKCSSEAVDAEESAMQLEGEEEPAHGGESTDGDSCEWPTSRPIQLALWMDADVAPAGPKEQREAGKEPPATEGRS